MIKKTILAISLALAVACGGSKPAPVTPPPTVEKAPVVKVETAKVVLSETTTEYTNSDKSWKISFPDNMTVVERSDDGVKVSSEDHSMLIFMREASGDSLETYSQTAKLAFLAKGHSPTREMDYQIGIWPAKILIYSGGRGIVALTLWTTGSHTFAIIFAGTDGQDRVVAFKAAMDGVVIADKPAKSTAKPAKK